MLGPTATNMFGLGGSCAMSILRIGLPITPTAMGTMVGLTAIIVLSGTTRAMAGLTTAMVMGVPMAVSQSASDSKSDAMHDQTDPQDFLRRIGRSLRSGGVYLMQDIGGSARLENNLQFP